MARGQVALVTGASRGIGAEIATRLARAGARVLVAARNIDGCRALVESIEGEGGRAYALRLDVTDPESVVACVAEARREVGPVDWLVNNAGIALSAPLQSSEAEGQYKRHLDVNFHGARRVFEAVLPDMLAAGAGSVVQVASSAALVGYPYVAAYCASKHALLGYSRAAALELARKRVALNVVCPHYVESPMLQASVENICHKTGKTEEEARAFLAQENPGGVFVSCDEVAEATYELLAGDRTGVALELIGGGRRTPDPGLAL